MLNESVVESGHSILLSWLYPVEPQVREGWITLVYELRYRHLAQPDNWKVRHESVCSTFIFIITTVEQKLQFFSTAYTHFLLSDS